ncbi:hypothetical protein PF005_g23341 [Phytophthora fragariae]|uniref:Reverse transcriptase domain-containing protein n=2 Tax=Phytophthora fragariae TaxID=53985 RepID=A0A6A3WZV1_9STRA|nr:hypothetical protein PF005_g23341 [Phytophthora fragariae]KAE9194013.1 hypothetical protein PF002_g23730 [Phytophthora fragariae]
MSSGREDDLAQSDEVRDQEPMCKIGSQAEEVTRSPTQSATKQIPHEDDRACATAPTPDTIPRGLPDQASNDPEPNPDPETRRGEPESGSEVCYHDGGTLEAEEVDGEWAVLPEVSPATIEVRIEDLQVGDLTDNTEDEIRKLRDIIWAHRHLLIGKGNALPPAAVGAVCDIDVGDAAPIAQRVRKIAPQFREKVSDLLKGLLSAKIIRHSTSPWASPIVVIIKKNGVDIRLCIDYRLVNGLTKLMIYPMPLINDLLEDLDKVLWYCSLDMASGFWVVSMTDRARAISAFITPFGLFELIDNALYGFLRIPTVADQNTLTDLFEEGHPEEAGEPSVLERRSYIDDILVTTGSWDLLCDRVKALLEACDKWNISISVAKSFWGLKKVDYLGHCVSDEGLEAHPKDLSALTDLPFPRTLRAMQSFLGSLNYYRRFIEDMAIYASVLYELREVDFAAIRDRAGRERIGPTVVVTKDQQDDQATADPKWTEAEAAFSKLKEKIAATPILRHFDTVKRPVVIVYASEWAVSASLVQDHDGVYLPVMFTSRTLKQNELNYGIVEKEVLALLRMLDLGYSMLAGRPVQVLARHSTLAWLFRAAGLQGRLGQWAALLSPWTLEITKCTRGEDEILGTLAAAITPRSEVDQALTAIAPRKEPRRSVDTPVPTVEQDETLLVASFDGSARVKRGGGAFNAIIWRLPEWTVVKAASGWKADMTVNEAEYSGLLLCFDLLEDQDRTRLVICGDSNLVIRQMKGEIDCKAPALTLLRQKALRQLGTWPAHDLLHVKRAWNASADSLASAALQREAGVTVQEQDWDDLVTLNRLPEILTATTKETSLRISAMATRSRRKVPNQEVLQEDAIRQLRVDRIRQGQDEEKWIANLKHYLRGQVADLEKEEARACSNLADDFEMDEQDLLYYCPPHENQTRRGTDCCV